MSEDSMEEKPKAEDNSQAQTEPTKPEDDAPEKVEMVGQNVSASVDSALGEAEIERLTNDMIAAIKTVYDPEIPSDIFELGLIYRIDVDDDRNVIVDMTLTAPGCPVAGEMPVWVENAVRSVEGVADVTVNLVFDPPWTPERMSDEARVALNMFY